MRDVVHLVNPGGSDIFRKFSSVGLLTFLNSAYFFLSIAKFGLAEWLAFNACSVSIIVYLVCFTCFQYTKKEYFLPIALVPLYYHGTTGLFLMSWDLTNMFSQITHIIITLNVIWILFMLLKDLHFESLGKGLLMDVLLFVPVFAVIQRYTQIHMEEYMQLLRKASLFGGRIELNKIRGEKSTIY